MWISYIAFEILTHIAIEKPSSHYPCLTPSSRKTQRNINIIYTSLKTTFSELQFRRWHYGSIIIRLAVVASQTCEITLNSEKKIRTRSTLRPFKVIHLFANRKRKCNFLLVNNSNYGRISYRWRKYFREAQVCLGPLGARAPCIAQSAAAVVTPWILYHWF